MSDYKILLDVTKGISTKWIEILFHNNVKRFFPKIIKKIEEDKNILCPQLPDIFNFARYTDIDDIKVIFIEHAPHHTFNKQGNRTAHGLAYSAINNSIPSSLQNIYKCLHANGLIKHQLNKSIVVNKLCNNSKGTGQLYYANTINWALQGILLMNMSLTTKRSTPEAHLGAWKQYVNGVLKLICAYKEQKKTPLTICLWGITSQKLAPMFKKYKDNIVLEFAHPLSSKGVDFTKCNHFKLITEKYGINWEPVRHIVAFTDGACSNNGRKNAKSSWGLVYKNFKCKNEEGKYCTALSGLTNGKQTNNRGELIAVIVAIEKVIKSRLNAKLSIFTDSMYVIGLSKGNKAVANKDLYVLLMEAKAKCKYLKFYHVKGHKKEPSDIKSFEWFTWNGNRIADKLATDALKHNFN